MKFTIIAVKDCSNVPSESIKAVCSIIEVQLCMATFKLIYNIAYNIHTVRYNYVYMSKTAKINNVSTNYIELYFC